MKLFKVGIACALVCACSGSKQASSDKLSLSVEGNALASDAGSGAAVSRIRLSVASIKLEGPADGADAGIIQSIELSEGPFLVDLSGTALNGGLSQVFDTDVPAGSYREFSVNIAPATGAALGDLGAQGLSLIVDGTFHGAAFSFTSKLKVTEKKEGTFTVGADTGNVTLSFDSSGWFGTAAAPLDPSVAANAPAIEANIIASLSAFRDDDRNGHDDDDDHRDGGTVDGGDDHGHDDGGDDHGADDGGDDHGQDGGVAHGGDDHGNDDAGAADGGDDHGGHHDGGH
jgi:hypothetical protein